MMWESQWSEMYCEDCKKWFIPKGCSVPNNDCPDCGRELGRRFVKIDDHGGYDFILGVEYDCECGYYRVDK